MIPDGYQNEFLFVLEFNNKKVKELNPLLREVPPARNKPRLSFWEFVCP